MYLSSSTTNLRLLIKVMATIFRIMKRGSIKMHCQKDKKCERMLEKCRLSSPHIRRESEIR